MPGTKRICEVQLNFRHFHTNSKKFFETVYFPRKNQIRLQKGQYYFFSILRSFRPFYNLFQISKGHRTFPKTAERLSKTNEEVRPLIARDVRRTHLRKQKTL